MKDNEFAHTPSLDQLVKHAYKDRYVGRMFVAVTFDCSADAYTLDSMVDDIFRGVVQSDQSTVDDLTALMDIETMKSNVDSIYDSYIQSLMNEVRESISESTEDNVNLSVHGEPKFEPDRSFETDVKLHIEYVYRDTYNLYKDDFEFEYK